MKITITIDTSKLGGESPEARVRNAADILETQVVSFLRNGATREVKHCLDIGFALVDNYMQAPKQVGSFKGKGDL